LILFNSNERSVEVILDSQLYLVQDGIQQNLVFIHRQTDCYRTPRFSLHSEFMLVPNLQDLNLS